MLPTNSQVSTADVAGNSPANVTKSSSTALTFPSCWAVPGRSCWNSSASCSSSNRSTILRPYHLSTTAPGTGLRSYCSRALPLLNVTTKRRLTAELLLLPGCAAHQQPARRTTRHAGPRIALALRAVWPVNTQDLCSVPSAYWPQFLIPRAEVVNALHTFIKISLLKTLTTYSLHLAKKHRIMA